MRMLGRESSSEGVDVLELRVPRETSLRGREVVVLLRGRAVVVSSAAAGDKK